MYIQRVIDFLKSDHIFSITKVLKQHWKQARYSYGANPRPDYGVMLLLHGEVRFTARDTVLTAKAGDVVFLPKDSRYEAVFENEAEDYLVNFDAAEKISELMVPVRLLRNAPLSCSEGFASLMEEYLSGSRSSLRSKGLFYLLLDSIAAGACAASSGKWEMIEKAKKLLSGEDDLQIPEIARRCGVSESGFRKAFRAAVGLTPAQYRLEFKLAKAKYLLESTDLNVREIADTLRFYDTAYFCRTFKKYAGMSPMQFAKRKQL